MNKTTRIILIIVSIIVSIYLSLMIVTCLTGCKKVENQSKRRPANSSNTESVITEWEKFEIIDNTVVHSFYYYGDTTEIVFTYNNGMLESATLTRECRDSEMAQVSYDNFFKINEHASQPMYEDIKLEGLTLTLKYTDFIMQDYKYLSQEELKAYLENEAILP